MKAKNSRKSLPLRADYAALKTALTPPETVKRVGYVRVSTGEQNTDLQYDALKKAGCDPIFEDRITGVALTRDGLDRALAHIGHGDKLVVWRLDRLGRSIPHVMTIVGELADKDASLVSIGEGFDTGNEAGELYSTILAMIAHVERRMIVARTKAGLQAARMRGVRLGAKPKLIACEVAQADTMIRGGTKAEAVAHKFHVSRATLFRHLRVHRSAQNLPN
ncbi:MAG: recombinase family protein [Sphingomonadales bacterium]|jgi:DNA invertase Pin-like site-specific DNA recombinase|nr:recombinase family protein [Sphingomonadales bacterium]MBK9269453.1 recombinase family protein [Sphingomonadales bacterium]MBP6434778.1 recombinase family protein [Sphingorhabdus sp.]